MPQKRDTATDRLRDHIKNERNGIARQLGLVDQSVVLGSAYKYAQMHEKSDWHKSKKRAVAANQATTIDARDAELKKAFDEFGLQAQNPFHWRKLMYYFSDAHFGTQKRVGRRATWSSANLCILLQDFDQVRRRFAVVPGSNVNELRFCELLKNDSKHKEKYSTFSAKTILRNLQRARNPKHNKILNGVVSDVAERIIAAQGIAKETKRKKVDLKLEKLIRSAVLPEAIESLSRRRLPDATKLFDAAITSSVR